MTMHIGNMDPAMVLKDATQSDAVRQKLDMDALRSRLGDPATKQEKLREACEGFESIFLQKMWEQMRKNVPKEGYLHSKDEETYQSLFDVELCKKMASAGGIGLADMLYEQLSQQLENTGRTTTPSNYRMPLDIAPSTALLPPPLPKESAAENEADAPLKAEDLYSPLPPSHDQADAPPPLDSEAIIMGALDEIKADLGLAPQEKGVAAREWAQERAKVTGSPEPDSTVVAARPPLAANAVAPDKMAADVLATNAVTAETNNKTEKDSKQKSSSFDPGLLSWQGQGQVSATPRPFSPFAGRAAKLEASDANEDTNKTPRRGMAPDETLWPLKGKDQVVTASFGWEDDPATGKRRWNSGIRIAAEAGSPVRAVLDGTVVYAGPREGAGNSVVLEHAGGYRSYYGNLMPSDVKIGDTIKHGAEFAKIASQASSPPDQEKTASLHFELKKGEMALNPEIAIPRLTTASR